MNCRVGAGGVGWGSWVQLSVGVRRDGSSLMQSLRDYCNELHPSFQEAFFVILENRFFARSRGCALKSFRATLLRPEIWRQQKSERRNSPSADKDWRLKRKNGESAGGEGREHQQTFGGDNFVKCQIWERLPAESSLLPLVFGRLDTMHSKVFNQGLRDEIWKQNSLSTFALDRGTCAVLNESVIFSLNLLNFRKKLSQFLSPIENAWTFWFCFPRKIVWTQYYFVTI